MLRQAEMEAWSVSSFEGETADELKRVANTAPLVMR
jgi:hypothetical protein